VKSGEIMTFWNHRPNLFRIIIITGSILVFAVIGIHLSRNITSTTDENLFQTMFSNFVTTEDIVIYDVDTTNSGIKVIKDTVDIKKGAFIVAIDNKKFLSPQEFNYAYDAIPPDSLIPIYIISTNKVSKYRIEALSYQAYFKKSDFPEDFAMFVKSGVLVVEVFEDGASDRAGMLPGDIIVKINGQSFKNIYEADRLLRNEYENKSFDYTVLRGIELVELELRLAKYGFNLDLLIKSIAGFLFFIFGFFLLMKKPELVSARLLGYFFALIGFLHFLSVINRYFYEDDTLNFIIFALSVISYTLAMPILFHVLLYLPKEKPELLKKKWSYVIPYVLGFLLLVLLIIIRSINVVLILESYWSIWINLILLYIVVFRIIYRKKISKEDKRMLRPLKLVFLLTLMASLYLMIFFQGNMVSFEVYLPIIAQTLLPFATLYMIGRYRLLGLDIRLRKNIQYFLFSYSVRIFIFLVFVVCVYIVSGMDFEMPNLVITGTSIEVLEKPLRPELQDFYENLIVILISIIAGLLLLKSERKLQDILSQKFHRLRFDYRQVNREFSDIVANSLSVHDVAKKVVADLAEMMKIKSMGLVILKNDRVFSQEYYGFKSYNIKEFINVSSNSIVESLRHFKTEFPVEYLQKEIKKVFLECGFVYVIPIKTKETTMGMLLVGEKLSESPYKQEDFEFFISVAAQLSMTIENFYLLENCTVQERIKHELEIARKIQLASLPQKQPDLKELDISGISIPALEVGGDFYDYFNGKLNNITVVIGDVSGKGTSAALYMSRIQGILRTLHEFDLSPKELLVKTNNLLNGNLDKRAFITAISARINYRHRTMTFSRAGHLPVYAFRKRTAEVERMVPKGLILGLANLTQFLIIWKRG
jgi:sigma-B regulation protein RsbU (phosphoserine phosphatase)